MSVAVDAAADGDADADGAARIASGGGAQTYRLDKLANDVTHLRLKQTLERLAGACAGEPAERLVRFRTERQRVSAERSQDTQRLEEALIKIADTERAAEQEAEAAVVSAIMGMHGAVGRGLIDEARRRDDGNHALQIESNAATALLRDAVHKHAAAAAASVQKLNAELAAGVRELEDMLAQLTSARTAAHARVTKAIEDAVEGVESKLAAERAARKTAEEGIASFMDRTISKIVVD